MQGGWGSGGESCISGRYDGCFASLAASEAILQAAASHTKAFGLPRVRWRDTCQVEQAGSGGVEAFNDDEPDWEGGRARERKGLKWNKISKTGFDAVVRPVPHMGK